MRSFPALVPGLAVLAFFLPVFALADGHEKATFHPAVPQADCPSIESETLGDFMKMVRAPSAWRSIDVRGFRMGLVDSPADVLYLAGYSEGDLKRAGLKFEACRGLPDVFRVEEAKRFSQGPRQIETENYHLFLPDRWIPLFDKKSEAKLVSQTGLPLAVFDRAALEKLPDSPFKRLILSPDGNAHVVLHELFHAYQSRFESPGTPDDVSLAKCRKSAEWKRKLSEELADWESLVGRIANEPKEKLRLVARQILRRRASADPSVQACWRLVEAQEWSEGMPTYFATAASKRAGLDRMADPRFLYENRKLSIDNPELFDDGREFFYLTGSLMGQLLDRLNGNLSWQTDLEKGTPPARLLERAVGD